MRGGLVVFLLVLGFQLSAQIMYQNVTNKNVSLGGYGRVGVDWEFEKNSSVGRRLNLNQMGSIGGRMEEQDYMELAPAFHFRPSAKYNSSIVNVQLRFAAYSRSLSYFGNSSTSSLGGLTFAIPEIYAEARNIGDSGVNFWLGSRMYRGPDVHIADYFYFNDHTGQGFGLEYKNSRFCALFISSTDTAATVPPYFYLNIITGTPSIGLRQRLVLVYEHDFSLSDRQMLTMLAEYHHMGKVIDADLPEFDTQQLEYPEDYGWVLGLRLTSTIKTIENGSINRLAVRYGARLANGGDGGISRTWMTFGAPDLDERNYSGAYAWSVVDDVLLNLSDKNTLSAYLIYNLSKGAASTNCMAETFMGKEVYNRKEDFTVGLRHVYYLSDIFHLMGEVHFSQRKDGDEDTYSTVKLSFVPTLVPTGNRDFWARPHFRFVASIARYNDAAMKNLYSPYLHAVGEMRWGFYFGVKAEWFIWE